MNPCELTVFISSLASALAKNLSNEELQLLSAVFTQLGDSFNTFLIQRENCEPPCTSLPSNQIAGNSNKPVL
ncbi:MAG: DUF6774 domain-containing protein [Oscillospiraceae bacterium]|jgi:hypothetical protein|nr:protein of unknown function [Ruminococcaceae bacterium BL-4]